MAEGGGFRRSVDIGSDVLYDFSCTPCAYKNINKEAEMYCVECREYFCVSCYENHNTFTIMRTHQILDKAGMSAQSPQQTPQMVLTEICQIHHGNTIDTYCPVHQAVGCGTCIALQHRSCKGIEYIPKAAQGFKKSKEYKDIKPAIKSSLQQLKTFKTTIQTDLNALYKERDVALKEIREYRKSIENELDIMEKKITDEVHTKYKSIKAEVTANINNIEDTMSKLESSLKNLEGIKAENEAEIFVFVKNVNRTKTETEHLLQTLNSVSQRENIQFKQNRTINECIKHCGTLGELHEELTKNCNKKVGVLLPKQNKLLSVSLTGEHNVKVKTDTENCTITDCTFLNDGTLLITDNNNKKLKRLSISFQSTDFCDLPGRPCGLCVTDNKQVAVALPEKMTIQIVSVGKKMKMSRSFTTTGYCSGLAYNNQTIFVSNYNSKNVDIHNENGQFLKTITVDISDLTRNKHYTGIALSTDNSKLIFSNGNNGIITVSTNDGKRKWVCSDQIKFAKGLCVLKNDNILVADSDHNIFQITDDGHMLGTVVHGKYGFVNPVSVCVDKANSKLIVTESRSDKIKAFKLII